MFRILKAASILLPCLLLAALAASQEPGRIRLDPHVLLASREEVIVRVPQHRPAATQKPRTGGGAAAGGGAVRTEHRDVLAAIARARQIREQRRREAMLRELALRRQALEVAQSGYEQLRG